MNERVVVLGAGAGGTMLANRLDRSLAAAVEVTVVDRSPTHRYQPALYLDPFGYLDLDAHERDVRQYLRRDVGFREATVIGVDPTTRTVRTDEETLPYDRLVVALGHALDHEAVDGLTVAPGDDVYPFYDPAAARAFGTALTAVVDDDHTAPVRLVVSEPDTPVSCGGAALKLAMLAEDYLTDRGVACEAVVAGPDAHVFGSGRKARYDALVSDLLADRAVRYVGDFETADVDRDAGLVRAADGRTLEYDLYAPVSPQRCPSVLTDRSPLTTDRREREYVDVDPETLRHERHERVYALGDCTDLPTSKTAAAARKQAAVLARNLVVDITDRGTDAAYGGFAACPLLTERGRAVLAMYDYDGPVAPAVESRLAWHADVDVVPRLYWSVWLRGYALGV